MRELYAELPVFRRARGFRLYDGGGRRYLDLYQNGGAAILGHGDPRVSRAVKAALSRGETGPLPSVYTGRLRSALHALLPGYPHIYFFPSRAQAVAALAEAAETGESAPPAAPLKAVPDPATGTQRGEHTFVSLWRPFLPEEVRATVLLPVLPFAMADHIQPVCVQDGGPELVSGALSPVILAGAVAALAAYTAFVRQPPAVPPHEVAVWERFDHPLWTRRGPYMSCGLRGGEYSRLFRHFLQRNIVLPPDPEVPVILPYRASAGELHNVIESSSIERGG